jgi:hypothetical protein
MFAHTPRLIPEKAVFRPALALCLSSPGSIGTNVSKMSYAEQLKHPNWQRKRLEMLEAAQWQCESCGGGDTTLHVHHRRYIKGRMAWEYSNDELAVLCEPCHKKEHASRETLDRLILLAENVGGLDVVCGLLAGFIDGELGFDDLAESKAMETRFGPDFVTGQIASLMGRIHWGAIGEFAESQRLRPGTFNPAQDSAIAFLREFKGQ